MNQLTIEFPVPKVDELIRKWKLEGRALVKQKEYTGAAMIFRCAAEMETALEETLLGEQGGE